MYTQTYSIMFVFNTESFRSPLLSEFSSDVQMLVFARLYFV